jgi:hypothetical protein
MLTFYIKAVIINLRLRAKKIEHRHDVRDVGCRLINEYKMMITFVSFQIFSTAESQILNTERYISAESGKGH